VSLEVYYIEGKRKNIKEPLFLSTGVDCFVDNERLFGLKIKEGY